MILLCSNQQNICWQLLLTVARWPKIVQVIQKELQKYLFVEELCSEFFLREKYFLPKPLQNTNMTWKNFWYFEDFFLKLSWKPSVVFSNKRSQAKVFTVYLSLTAGYSYLECNNYTLTLNTWSTELNQYARYLYSICTLNLHWPVRN